jgi:hypothetical protein
MSEGQEELLDELADNWHIPPWSTKWFEHETSWFALNIPSERNMAGWIFNYIRPNAGISGGGVVLWDDTGWFHMESPYYRHYYAMPKPKEELDLRDFRFPSGLAIKMLEPMTRYHLAYDDPTRLTFDLEFEAVMKPWVDVAGGETPTHFDQMGRITGQLTLHGKKIDVDCYAMRDRSWGRVRSEKWETSDVGAYSCASAGTETSVFVMGFGAKKKGFLVLDSKRSGLVEGRRDIERHPDEGWITSMVLAGTDAMGRRFETECECLSRIAMPIPGVGGVCWTSLFRCELEGVEMWGEDQDFWSLYAWSAARRRARGLQD